ncbi:alpha-D-ribose 1-methylphosphonate 5-triphosphate diphosphatase [Paracoccus solventivorans]|uniref:Alpha-D-ribose 1-methylphosphonate 5-triphosphate diphosphatase n=1 Tax=Paracoccus solventivorans TaxID=53463 RepID=A0A1M7DRU6_9RHOB|nr:alpha-D-ribose 1-methylphosphonate 5-triphosphate diphosphatase [Paracoccus solventivorans]SHL82147.1 alpha-D-ribose 1-methylphosphonate 5-triphosphate diphosphatase [Paracoccus solventivorans]
MTETILANATLVLPAEVLRGQIRLRDGIVADITAGQGLPAGAIDCGGDLVLPGLIELHTDNLERHLQPRPRAYWPHQAAIIAHDAELAAMGITTVFDALRVGSIVSDPEANYGEYARELASEIMGLRAQGALRISHFLHLRAEICSETLVDEMARFGPDDRVGIVSLMDHTPGERQFRDLSKLRDYYTGRFAMTDAMFETHVAQMTALRDRLGERHERTAVAEARRYGATLASHDDTTAAQVAVSAAHGVHFAEFPTTEEAARACRNHGILVMMGAPNLVRGGSHSGNVAAAALADEGLLDILSSDYVPSSLLTGALMLGDQWGDLARGVATVTQAPAQATGLADRGRLQVGARADVIRVARIGAAAAVRGTWVQGRRV